MGILAFLSDFGLKDPYVGTVKGVILGINSQVRIVDLTHQVPSQDVFCGAMHLWGAYRAFPVGTVFLAVVDPGVGSSRRALVLETRSYRFVAPDNGILTGVIKDNREHRCVEIKNSSYFRHPVSNTFHARDIFGPVAAHISAGVSTSMFGPVCKDIELLEWFNPVTLADRIQGRVIYKDVFGNLVTDIPWDLLKRLVPADSRWIPGKFLVVEAGGRHIPLASTYSDVPPGAPLALEGSLGLLEIAVNRGSASSLMRLGRSDNVLVRRKGPSE